MVKDFSTAIYRGDKVGIIGPNGCGKTTLLNLLLGQSRAPVGPHEAWDIPGDLPLRPTSGGPG